MKRFVVLSVTMAALLGSATLATAQCALTGFGQLLPNTPLALGDTMYYYAANFADVGLALVNARDAWDSTEAANRIGNWDGIVPPPGSDCPTGRPLQVGAFDFNRTDCPTINAYRNLGYLPPDSLAFVDYYWWFCPGCGTKSVTLNLSVAWSLNPGPMQYDIQSVLTHEFGHMLGFSHINGVFCSDATAPGCALYPDRNTMTSNIPDGDTCERTLSGIDAANANYLY